MIFREGNGYAGLPLCPLTVRPGGKAELRFAFDATNVEGYGMAMEHCLAVVVLAAGGSDTAAPLCGYREGSLPWRSGFKVMEKKKAEVRPPDPAPVPIVTVVEPEVKSEIEVVKLEIAGPEVTVEEIKALAEEASATEPDELDETEEDSPVPPPHDPESGITDAFKDEVEAILKSHTHMKPFEKQNRQVQWVRISLDENLSLPNYICDLLSEPFVESAYRLYNHLILGTTADTGPKRYYIGVPALYDPKDKLVGFRQFKTSENKDPILGDYGYWLIFMS
jgi:hypothetical protein